MNTALSGYRVALGVAALLAAAVAHAQAPNISTVLGRGNGDGAQARHAQFNNVYAAVFDVAGNAYIADGGDDNVRKIAGDGTISTVAGSGPFYYAGSCANGTATAVRIAFPQGIALDHNGNPLIVDTYDSCVRRLNPDGTLTLVVGGGIGFSGDGGQAIDAGLSSPSAIAVDTTGNWYIADSGDNRVRKVDTSGKIGTIAGSNSNTYGGDGGDATSAGVYFPTGVAVDASGNVYIAEPFDYVVRKVDTLGKISTVAGNGTSGSIIGNGVDATSVALNVPRAVAVAPDGELYIADAGTGVISRVDAQGKIWPVAGTSALVFGYSPDGTPALGAGLGDIANITFDNSGRLIIMGGARVLRVETNATLTTLAGDAGYADGTAAAAASLRFAANAAVDVAGNLLVADTGNSRVRRLNRDESVDTIAGDGSGNYATGDGGPAIAAGLYQPQAVALDAAGNVYIAEYEHIRKVDATTQHISTFSNSAAVTLCGAQGRIVEPVAMAFDAHGSLYVADQGCDRVYAFDNAGNASAFAGTGLSGAGADNVPATQSAIGAPSGVAVDAKGNVYIVEGGNNRVRKVGLDGNIVTIAGTGTGTAGYNGDEIAALSAQLSGPDGVAVDPAGNVYISDRGNALVRRVGTDGMIHRVAGTLNVQGYGGDGGLATSAQLGGPQGLVYDRGTLFIVEASNSQVRAVDLGEIFANGFEP
jgi:sugar lactone lactonase YvrE